MSDKAEQKTFGTPDETRAFERGTLDLLRIGGAEIGRLTLQPGWRWSEHVKPLAGTELCEAPHFQYHVSGTLHVVMGDGAEFDAKPGDVTALPQGHDAWVVGDEPTVGIDFAATGSSLAGHVVRCPCGVEFRVASDDQLDHLVAAVRQHADASHGHKVTAEQVLAEVTAS